MSISKDVVIVETIRGQISGEDVAQMGLCLLHERLSPIVHPVSCERPLTIQHIDYHRASLLSLENSSLTPGMIDHQLQALVHSSGKSIADVIILDGSNYETRLPELLQKYIVVKGYQYKLAGNPSEGQRAVLLSKEHIFKQTEYEFKLGNGKYKPGFIGELLLSECLEQSPYFNAFNAYLQYSAKSNCPIIINSLELGKQSIHSSLKGQASKEERSYASQTLMRVSSVLQAVHKAKVKKVVIYNLPFFFETVLDAVHFRKTTQNVLHSSILELLSKYDCYFGFDLARYAYNQHALHYIGQLVNAFPSHVVLSAGLACKTDLTPYAGTGYLYYKGERIANLLAIVGQQRLRSAFHHTKLKLLLWKIKKEEVKLTIFWKCSQCGSDQPEQVESFRKFGKQFCSIKCLKSHKF